MRHIPAPCVNCLRFHYRPCHDAPKQCWKCGVHGHLERFCPTRRRMTLIDRKGPLPGTNAWCEMFGLDEDHQLRRQVLMALKRSPDSAIIVDGRCIYNGGEINLTSSSARAVTRVRDERSLSPPRIREKRSRSPSARYQDCNKYRDRSPQRHYGESRSRSIVHDRYTGSRSRSVSMHRGRRYSRTPVPEFRHRSRLEHRPAPPRHAYGSISANISTPKVSSIQTSQNMVLPTFPIAQAKTLVVNAQEVSQLAADQNHCPTNTRFGRAPLEDMTNLAQLSPQPKEFLVDDAHFILGVGRGATEAEYVERGSSLQSSNITDH